MLQQKSQVHIIHGQIIGLSDFNPRVKGFNQVLKLGFTEQSYFLPTLHVYRKVTIMSHFKSLLHVHVHTSSTYL